MGRLAAAGPLAWAVLALGLLAAALMVATEFSTIQSVRVGDSTCGVLAEPQQQDICQTTGIEHHHGALLILGLFTALAAFGAAVGRSRPAAMALLGLGLAALVIALLLDRPTLDDVHGFDAFNRTEAVTGGGYTLEILAGILAVLACGLALLRERLRPQERIRRSERPPAGDDAAPDPAA